MLFGWNRRDVPKEEAELPCVGLFCVGNEEPTLKEVLSDPMIHQVAKSDKIAPEQLSGCVEEMRKKIFSKTEH